VFGLFSGGEPEFGLTFNEPDRIKG
jgi:hypothetical protein